MNAQLQRRVSWKQLFALAVFVSLADDVAGQTFTWSNPQGGSFQDPTNWSPAGGPPGGSNNARFDLDETYGVHFTASATNWRSDFVTRNVSMFLDGHTYSLLDTLNVGTSDSGVLPPILALYNGTVVATEVRAGFSNQGTLIVDAGAVLHGASVTIGGPDITGRMVVQNGAQLYAVGIGVEGGLSTELVVKGPNTTVRTVYLTIGWFENGAVAVRHGATLSVNGSIEISGRSGSEGVLELLGDGTVLNHTAAYPDFGFLLGSGTARIRLGRGTALNTNSDINFGYGEASIFLDGGTLNVQGSIRMDQTISTSHLVEVNSGALLNLTGPESTLFVGDSARLRINGGTVTTRNFSRTFFGDLEFNDGVLAITGGTFDYGIDVNGPTLTINGQSASSSPTLRLAGPGAIGQNVGTLNVGYSRKGTLEILDGAHFALSTVAASLRLGVDPDGTGAVLVDGANSRLTNVHTLILGDWGTGILTITGGGAVVGSPTSRANIGDHLSGAGTALVSGIGSSLAIGTTLRVGYEGSGSLSILNGGLVRNGQGQIADRSGSTGDVVVSGPGARWENNLGLYIGGNDGAMGGRGTLTIGPGGTVEVAGETRIWNSTGTALTINGGTLLTDSLSRRGTLTFNDGAIVVRGGSFGNGTSPSAFYVVGNTPAANPTLTLQSGATTDNITNANIGSSSRSGTLVIKSNANFVADGVLWLQPAGTIHLSGGNLAMQQFVADGTFNWDAGRVSYMAPTTFGSSHLQALLGTSGRLSTGRELNGDITLAANLLITGGTLSGPNITNGASSFSPGRLQVNQGSVLAFQVFRNNADSLVQLGDTGQIRTLTSDGGIINEGEIQMSSLAATLESFYQTTNHGRLTGTGTIRGGFVNSSTGVVRVTGAERLVFAGANNTNSGNIDLAGGTVEFTEQLTNTATGAITGRGLIHASSANPGGPGITNSGVMTFSAGFTDIRGDVVNNGRIVTGGGGVTTFYDDVVNNNEIRTNFGARTVFFGDQSGAGTFPGTGTVEYDGDFRPGNSPANILYEGNVVFSSSARLVIELGGLLPGTGYDQLTIARHVELDGILDVRMIDGFVAAPGDAFTIINNTGSQPVSGTFLHLPEGKIFPADGGMFQITYQGGTGNDVVLFSVIPEPTTISLVSLTLAGVGCWWWQRRRWAKANGPATCGE